ncbi:Uncharacterised protein [Mycoplasmopsis maculosa]|uniref:Uncharacterized protein n=1 Tax=Mycoplasmopsis maculosa TaxID=114885 RepID=A0A449B4N7_9BACT|nr:hypothetical protein [Mycoplasmopsis maculosa]VEU75567.1 Uncharacterised protein [Mycoplasmopsis maculosa]
MKNKIKFWITPIIFNSVAFSFISSNINEEYTANNSVELNNKIKEMLNKNDQENNNYEFFLSKRYYST